MVLSSFLLATATVTLAQVPTLSHSPITIRNDTDFLLPASGVRGGVGTSDMPFVISGWHIDSDLGEAQYGIRIENTRAHVLIQDISMDSVFEGIHLNNARNVSLHLGPGITFPLFSLESQSRVEDTEFIGVHLPLWGRVSLENVTIRGPGPGGVLYESYTRVPGKGGLDATGLVLDGAYLDAGPHDNSPIWLNHTRLINSRATIAHVASLWIEDMQAVDSARLDLRSEGPVTLSDMLLLNSTDVDVDGTVVDLRNAEVTSTVFSIGGRRSLQIEDLRFVCIDDPGKRRDHGNDLGIGGLDVTLLRVHASGCENGASINGENVSIADSTFTGARRGHGLSVSGLDGGAGPITITNTTSLGGWHGISANSSTQTVLHNTKAAGSERALLSTGGEGSSLRVTESELIGRVDIVHNRMELSNNRIAAGSLYAGGSRVELADNDILGGTVWGDDVRMHGNNWSSTIGVAGQEIQMTGERIRSPGDGIALYKEAGDVRMTGVEIDAAEHAVWWRNGLLRTLVVEDSRFEDTEIYLGGIGPYQGEGRDPDVRLVRNWFAVNECRFEVNGTMTMVDNVPEAMDQCGSPASLDGRETPVDLFWVVAGVLASVIILQRLRRRP